MADQEVAGPRGALHLYVGLTVVAAIVVSGAVVAVVPTSVRPPPSPWLIGSLWALAMTAASVKVGLPVRGVGGVREYTSLVEIAAVVLMVSLAPAWAIAVAVTASLASEAAVHRNGMVKMVFNSAAETLCVALGALTFHTLAGSSIGGSPQAIGAALGAAAIYIIVGNATFLGLVAVLSGHARQARQALHGTELRSSVLLSLGLATTGVLAAVLAAEAPWALPLMLVPAVLNHLQARHRQESLQLAAAKDAADAANRAKSDFLARMSHELRTPLNAILGFGQLLGTDPALDETARENAGFILRAGEHLLTVIGEVLDLSQVEAGRLALSLAPVDIAALAGESVDIVRPLAHERDIDLVLTAAEVPRVQTDVQRLRQVLLNLLSNAVKYNREGGGVTVTIDRSGGEVRLAVTDTGAGIAPADLEKLFVPFERLGMGATNVPGTGLGLSVSRHFVEAMGGRIEVTSEIGRGSTFAVLLPAMTDDG